MVKVKYLLMFKDRVKKDLDEIPAKTIKDLLYAICKKYPNTCDLIFDENKNIRKYLLIVVNGNRVLTDFIDRGLSENDEVIVSTPAGGG